jgi:monoterpene epsilon-lactone hydrolase
LQLRGLPRATLLAVLFFLFGLWVALRRVFRGPLRPGWTWRQETFIGYMRWVFGRLARGGIVRMQRAIDGLSAPARRLLTRVTTSKVDLAGRSGEWITPKEGQHRAVLYYLHGGGYVICSVETHRHLIARLALAAPARALAINYRRAPQHRFPAAVEDAVAGYRWLLARPEPPASIVLVGDSAGGGLALATLLALREANDPLPAAAVLLSPWVDLAADDDSMTENAQLDYLGGSPGFLRHVADLYLGEQDPRDPLASPVYGDLRGLPPMLIQVGGVEMLHDQAERLAARARGAGVPTELDVWPEMVHVWHAFGRLFPQAHEAIARIAAFIQQHVPPGA